MPFQIIRNDITRVEADAVVNTANPEPCCGSGTDAAVYQAAGAEELLAARKKIGRIAPGEAAATAAFRLPARYIIHTVGPSWIDGEHGEFEILRSCYRKSLLLADQLGCRSIAFPLIATGVYGFPKDKALETALGVIREHLEESELDVTLVVFGNDSFRIAEGLSEKVKAYIDEKYVAAKTAAEYGGLTEERAAARRRELRQLYELSYASSHFEAQTQAPAGSGHPAAAARPAQNASGTSAPAFPGQNAAGMPAPSFAAKPSSSPKAAKKSLEDAVKNLGESFQQRLLRMIDERGMTDPEVYNRANVDRKVFSKIRCSEDYIPKKRTILALAIAMQLNLDDAKDLLASAGYALTTGSLADVIAAFCFDNGIYNIYEVNMLLFQYDQPQLP